MKKLAAGLAGLGLALGLVCAAWAGPATPAGPGAATMKPSVPGKTVGTNGKKPAGKTKMERLGKKKIDINHARQATLQRLPGVGPVTAKKIVDARKQQPFTSVDELVSRKIMAASDLAKIRDNLMVRPVTSKPRGSRGSTAASHGKRK
jgi:DNA uptake protein ComE-like DNA-binding protein